METDVRLKALTRLAQSTTDAAKSALLTELDEAAAVLKTQNDYESLLQSLEVLNVVGYRFSDRTVDAIDSFIQTIEGRGLTYSQEDEGFADYIAKYKNAQSLIIKALEVVVRLRYYETRRVLRILLALHSHPSESVRKKVRSGLDSLVKYDLDVFYGADRKGGIGPAPQSEVLGVLESMDDLTLKADHELLLRLLTGMLSPILEGVSWTYDAATISHAAIPALPSVSEIRARSIQLLMRLYKLAGSTQQKLAAIGTLSEGTRTDHRGSGNEKTREMIARDTIAILAFFVQLVPIEDFQVVQMIESKSYRIFVNAFSEEVKAAALKVEKAIADNKEYAIYRTLVGFEGIFGDWSTYVRASDQFQAIENQRRQRASDFAREITSETYFEWRGRILEYAKTESDDLATFPVFYHFLAEFAAARPDLAVRLASEDTAGIARFLIPILYTLWNSSQRDDVRKLIEKWIGEARPGNHHLFAAIKMFLSSDELEVGLLKRLLEKAAEVNDIPSVRQVVTVAIARWEDTKEPVLTELLYPALDVLTAKRDGSWISDAWFRKEARRLFAEINADGIEHVLRNLLVFDKIDYHAEEVLFSLAQRVPERVLKLLIQRIAVEVQTRSDSGTRDFEAIPFEFYKLQEPLSKIPRSVVRSVLDQCRTDDTLFAYRGGTLLKNIFPAFSEELEAELLQLVLEGSDSNLEFVIGVLRNYQGEPFIHRLCKEIVKKTDSGNPLLNEVSIALESTGIVSGEFGMAEAYERKREEVLDWLSDPNEKVKAFAKRYIADLERVRDAEIKRAEEGIALRKFRFGED